MSEKIITNKKQSKLKLVPPVKYPPFDGKVKIRIAGEYKKSIFAVGICGDALINVGIFDGDFAIIERAERIQQGKLVACSTPHGLQVKFFYVEESGHIRLESRNEEYRSRIYAASDVIIQGIVREISRKLKY